MPNNPYTRKRGSPKSYMRKATLGQARDAAAVAVSTAAAAVSGTGGTVKKDGEDGVNGWSPVLGVSVDGERRVLRLVTWIGGSGEMPGHAGEYIGADGYVAAIGEGVDIRGPAGEVAP